MRVFRVVSAVEQLATHLREEIQRGELKDRMPGVLQLVRQLGVGTKTVVGAMEILKQEGMIEACGKRIRNKIIATYPEIRTGLKVCILLYEEGDASDEHIVRLGYSLEQKGHKLIHAKHTLSGLKFDAKRVARMVEQEACDAWIVVSGSLPVLEWFCSRQIPVFALFGSVAGLRIASLSTVKSPAVFQALHRLVELGHRRIVMIVREERRKPNLGVMERRFLEELQNLGIDAGSYNLPDWEDDAQGLYHCMNSIFRISPPTALLIDQSALFFATQQFLLEKKLTVPGDVSLIVLEEDPVFQWFNREVSCISIEFGRIVSRITRWVENVANNKQDHHLTLLPGKFIEGATIGPARGSSRL